MRRWRLAPWLAVALVLHPAVTGASRADARELVGLRLAAQSIVVAVGEDLQIEVDVDAGLAPDAVFTVSARPLPSEREALLAGVRDPAATLTDSVEVRDEYVVRAGERVHLTIPTETENEDPARLALAPAGAFAIAVTVSGIEGAMTTVVVREDGGSPLRLAIGMALDSPLTLQPDGSTSIDPEVRDTVTRLADLLERAAVPVTLTIRPELLEGLVRSGVPGDRELVDRLGAAVSPHTVLAVPTLHLDPSAAAGSGLDEVFTSQLRMGEDVLSDLLGQFPDRRVWMATDPLSDAGAGLVRDLGANVIVRMAGRAEPSPAGPDAAPPGDRAAVPVLIPDPVGDDLATGSDDPVLTAAVLTAALVAGHRAAGDAGVVVMVDVRTADPATLEAFLRVVAAEAHVTPSRIDEAAQSVGQDGAPDVDAVAPVPDLSSAAATRTALTQLVSATAAMLTPGDTRGERWSELADALLDSRLDDDGRSDYANELRGTLVGIQSAVVVLSPTAVNLGDRSSTVPITIRNDNPFPVVVEVRLVSAKLRFPPTSDPTTVPAGGTAQLRIPVDARTNGRFPVTAELVAPGSGSRVGTPVTFSVRVGRLTGLGLVITFGAGLVLATWWVQHLRRRQRRRRGAETRERHPVASRE